MSVITRCTNCEHNAPHKLWGRCVTDGCDCRSYEPTEIPDGELAVETSVVVRDPATGTPIAIPDETIAEHDIVYRAYLKKRQGLSWEQIAYLDGWDSAQVCAAHVKAYLRAGEAIWGDMSRTEALAMEIAALDFMQTKLWAKAENGNVAAIHEIRGIIRDRVEYRQLGKTPDEAGAEGEQPTLTLIRGTDGAYAQDLRKAAGS